MTERRPRPDPTHRWASLTAPELAERVTADTVAILPTAAVEQHGPHLPLSTDVDIGEGLLADALGRITDPSPLLVLPTLAIGASPEHVSFPGTLDRTARGFVDDLVAVGGSVARAGVRRLVIFNSHGGNRASIDMAALDLRRRCGLLVVKVHTFRFSPPAGLDLPEAELRHGLHGGAVETALMLHLHPERVRHDRIGDFESLGQELERTGSRVGPEGSAAFAWAAEDLNPLGAIGNAGLATAEMGRALVDAWGGELAHILEDVGRFPLERLSGSTAAPEVVEAADASMGIDRE